MSNALAISAVTAVLQYHLSNVYNGPASALASVKVSAQSPDIVYSSLSANSAPLQVNVFMDQVMPNAAWRNVGLPSLGPDGATRLKNPLLALDLHYLLTAYASEDTLAEALLGYAALMLHEYSAFSRDDIRTALSNVPASNPLASALTTTGLAEQIELIKITPAPLGREEMAWLWTALKSDYRPTISFQVSVVLIQPQFQTSFALPVLSRNIAAQGEPLASLTAGSAPHLSAIQPPAGQTAFVPGDAVTVSGANLSMARQVALMNPRLGLRYPPFSLTAADVTDTAVTFTVPEDPANLPAGNYNLWLVIPGSAGAPAAATNILPLVIAPKILTVSASASGSPATETLVTVNCDPAVRPSQAVSLSVSGPVAAMASPAQPFSPPATTLTFQFPSLAGSYLVQLRVDGVDSPLSIQSSSMPPKFTGPVLTV